MPSPIPTRRAFIGTLALLPLLLQARPSNDERHLLLAHEASPDVDPAGYLVSEKYDGVRALWDGQTLRFRSGLSVAAPASFVSRLPAAPLDGELWLGRARFEDLAGLVRRATPDAAAWQEVRYMVFELPLGEGSFAVRAERLRALTQRIAWSQLVAAEQTPVPTRQALQQRLDAVVAAGGEGLMLHRADAPYRTGRSRDLLKLKPLHDAEAWVTGHVAGRGRHAGRLGALRVRTVEGVEFLLGNGFSDAQRERPPAPGVRVCFTHRGFTDSGVPRFASFLRVQPL
jgi:DNA ligase 1